MNSFETPAFKRLKKHYYDRLKESGFHDIEDEKNERRTKQNDSSQLKRRKGFCNVLVYESIVSYYDWAVYHAFNSVFQCDRDRIIWTAHSEGKSSRQISQIIGIDQSWICQKIKKIKSYLKTLDPSK